MKLREFAWILRGLRNLDVHSETRISFFLHEIGTWFTLRSCARDRKSDHMSRVVRVLTMCMYRDIGRVAFSLSLGFVAVSGRERWFSDGPQVRAARSARPVLRYGGVVLEFLAPSRFRFDSCVDLGAVMLAPPRRSPS